MNIFLHFITSPMGILGVVGLMRTASQSSSLVLVGIVAYLVSLLSLVPVGVFVGTALLCGVILFLARRLDPHWAMCLTLVFAGYVLQDWAHLLTNEPTFQSSYTEGNGQVFNRFDSIQFYCLVDSTPTFNLFVHAFVVRC